MAVVTSDFLAAVMTNYQTIFKQTLMQQFGTTQEFDKIATRMTSTTDKESYNWLGETPHMKEWTDTREYASLAAYTYELTNIPYEATLEVDRETYEDDKLGQIPPRVKAMTEEAIRHINEMVFAKLEAGTSDTAFDGTAMFADTRVIGSSANIDNLLAGAYSGSTTEIRTGLQLALQRMRNFQSDRGKPLGIRGDTIVCSPKMEMPITLALQPSTLGAARPELGYIKQIIVSEWIDADADDWYVLATGGSLKPLILQMRKMPEFTAITDPNSEHVFKNRTFLYGVDDRFVVGYSDPRLAVKIQDV